MIRHATGLRAIRWGLARVKRRRAVTLVAGLLAAAAGVVTFAAPASAVSYIVPIINEASGLCLQPAGGSLEQGAAIVQEPCDRSPAQQWTEIPAGGPDIFHYVNVQSGLCLDARGGATNGTPIQQWTCNDISNENWERYYFGADIGEALISRVSGTRTHCLDVPMGQQSPGVAMQLYHCNTTLAQKWWMW